MTQLIEANLDCKYLLIESNCPFSRFIEPIKQKLHKILFAQNGDQAVHIDELVAEAFLVDTVEGIDFPLIHVVFRHTIGQSVQHLVLAANQSSVPMILEAQLKSTENGDMIFCLPCACGQADSCECIPFLSQKAENSIHQRFCSVGTGSNLELDQEFVLEGLRNALPFMKFDSERILQQVAV